MRLRHSRVDLMHGSFSGKSFFFDRVALQKYILMCCQESRGGLIDKPGKYVLVIVDVVPMRARLVPTAYISLRYA